MILKSKSINKETFLFALWMDELKMHVLGLWLSDRLNIYRESQKKSGNCASKFCIFTKLDKSNLKL